MNEPKRMTPEECRAKFHEMLKRLREKATQKKAEENKKVEENKETE